MEDRQYGEKGSVGVKIKVAARIWKHLGFISCIVLGIVQFVAYANLANPSSSLIIGGIATILLGCFGVYLISLLIEGFGEIVCCQGDKADYAESEAMTMKKVAQSLESISESMKKAEESKEQN